ncbi:hypothetical protein [Stenotrophomonas sp. MMGLT7]|uniref:hypothetical protein n=1 Tax=Stenotrophomonas sp. MMGLT7 TaxID=2901227 RepID=UPI001E32CA18|nr:hypothetical protein [Stenotrophomonas sp. MMGLT7]MCD7097175.1 hypothetical protein [Stenotrophomonas sp. MMGLT7]
MERLLIHIERTVSGWQVNESGRTRYSSFVREQALEAADSIALGRHFSTGTPVAVVMDVGARESVLLFQHG